MTEKETYKALMQRYWDAETTPQEERELAMYAASTIDSNFEVIRGVLGYLSIGREKKVRKTRTVWMYSFAAVAASIVTVVAIGLNLGKQDSTPSSDEWVRYAYGEVSSDRVVIMETVDASLADFFGGETPAEANLIEMFKR